MEMPKCTTTRVSCIEANNPCKVKSWLMMLPRSEWDVREDKNPEKIAE